MPVIAAAAPGSGTSKITKTLGPSAGVLYIEISLPPAASISFLAASWRLDVGFSKRLLMARCVYCPLRQKCIAISSHMRCLDQQAACERRTPWNGLAASEEKK